MSVHRSPAEIRSSLKHPIIDGDGHWVEYNPVFAERMRKLAGDKAADGFLQSQRRIPDALKLSIAERKQRGIAMEGYWTRQSTNTRDRATAMMPRMLYDRLDELGIDFGIIYPTAGLSVPRVADDTLVPPLPQEGYGFPRLPGVVYSGVHHTGDLWDFGPDFDKGFISVLPPKLKGTPYPVFVPKADVDGNDIAGIRVPEVAVPVATYTGWGLRADGLDGCDSNGQKLDFAKTRAARLAAGDPRLSLEERYADHATYVERVSEAARALKDERFMLEEDVAATIAAAQAASVP